MRTPSRGFLELRDNRLRALRATRAHTVGYVGGCDEVQGEIESPFRVQGVASRLNSRSEVWAVSEAISAPSGYLNESRRCVLVQHMVQDMVQEMVQHMVQHMVQDMAQDLASR